MEEGVGAGSGGWGAERGESGGGMSGVYDGGKGEGEGCMKSRLEIEGRQGEVK